MLILIMAVMSDSKSFYAIEDFAQRHQEQLYQLLKLTEKKKRTQKTFERLLAALDFKSFSAMFYHRQKITCLSKKKNGSLEMAKWSGGLGAILAMIYQQGHRASNMAVIHNIALTLFRHLETVAKLGDILSW